MVTKKTTTKSSAKKAKKEITKEVAKKTTVKKPVQSTGLSTETKACPVSGCGSVWFWTTLLFLGALIGSFFFDLNPSVGGGSEAFETDQKIVRFDGQTYVSVKNLDENFLVELGSDKDFVVYDDKTWLPIPGKPVELIVLNDPACVSCNTDQDLAMLKQNSTPALLIRDVDVASEEGKALIEKFEMTSIPQYIFVDGITDLVMGMDQETGAPVKFIDSAKDFLIIKDEQYLLNGSAVGFKPGQYLKAPEFSDIDTEPVHGRGGKVRVVEFTDYQCPYCKSLHDNNKDLIAKLVKEGKIEYVLKDFPLDFHKEAVSAHKSANCVLKEAGDDAYWKMNSAIFDNTPAWANKGIQAANKYFIGLAKDFDADIATCIEDASLDAEIAADMLEGQKYGVSGTPALFIGKKFMPGAIDAKTFEAAVEEALKQ